MAPRLASRFRGIRNKWGTLLQDTAPGTKRILGVLCGLLLFGLLFHLTLSRSQQRFKSYANSPEHPTGVGSAPLEPHGAQPEGDSEDASKVVPSGLSGWELAPEPWTTEELTELAKVWIGIENALCSAHEVYVKHAEGQGDDDEQRVRGHAHAWRAFMAAIPSPPPQPARAQRRGLGKDTATRAVVIPAGGPGLMQLGLVALQALRDRAGCRLPVEIFYQDAGEAPTPGLEAWVRKTFAPVVFRNIQQVAQRAYELRANGSATTRNWYASCPQQLHIEGYGLKVFAMVLSVYDEILVLDSDNIPLLDPTGLFGVGKFGLGDIGGFFWTDYFGLFEPSDYRRLVPYRTMLKALGPPPCSQYEGTVEYTEPGSEQQACGIRIEDRRGSESGQILLRRRDIDRKRSFWRPLMLAVYMYHHRDFFYRHLYGDKDSYRLAALALHEPSEITPIALGSVGFYDDHGLFQGHGMLQFWPFPEELVRTPALATNGSARKHVLARLEKMGRSVMFLHRNQRKIPQEGTRLLMKQHFNLKVSCWSNTTGEEAKTPPRYIMTPEEGLTRLTEPKIVCVNTTDLVGFDVDAAILNYIENLWDRREWRHYLYSRNIY